MAQNTHQGPFGHMEESGETVMDRADGQPGGFLVKGRWSRGAVAIGATGAGGARASLGRQSTCNEEEAQ